MDFPTALLRDLLHLSSSVELDEDELGARLAALVTALRAAVPSYRGMHLTVVEADQPVGLSAFHSTEDGAITTSLRLPFAALAPDSTSAAESFYTPQARARSLTSPLTSGTPCTRRSSSTASGRASPKV